MESNQHQSALMSDKFGSITSFWFSKALDELQARVITLWAFSTRPVGIS